MKLSEKLVKKITYICLALTTALLVIVMETISMAQPSGNPNEGFPGPVTTWLLPVPTANVGISRPFAANPDVVTVPYKESRSIPVLSNDLGEGLTIIEVSQSDVGTTKINSDGTITYGSVNDIGTDKFTYTIRDQYGRTVIGIVFVEISFPQ